MTFTEDKKANAKKLLIKLSIVLTLIISLTLLSSCKSNQSDLEGDHKDVAEQFINATVSQDIEMAKKLSTGMVNFNLHNAQAMPSKAHMVNDVEIETLNLGNNWAVVNIYLETIDSESEINVFWYKLSMIKEDDWKVYEVKEVTPSFEDEEVEEEEIDRAIEAFINFYNKIVDGEYKKAGSYLAGKAKSIHESSGGIFRDTIITNNAIEELSAEALSGNEKHLVLKINYKTNNKEISNIVHYYKSSAGWKIYEVCQL